MGLDRLNEISPLYSEGFQPHLVDNSAHVLAFCYDCNSVTEVILAGDLLVGDQSYCLRCERLQPDRAAHKPKGGNINLV